MGVCDEYILQFEEHAPTQVVAKPKLRLMVLAFLFSDLHFDLLDGNNDVFVERVDED